jgi:hypothetical protein
LSDEIASLKAKVHVLERNMGELIPLLSVIRSKGVEFKPGMITAGSGTVRIDKDGITGLGNITSTARNEIVVAGKNMVAGDELEIGDTYFLEIASGSSLIIV